MNRTALVAAAGGAGGALALAGAFAGGYAVAHGHVVTRVITHTVTRTVTAPAVTRIVYRTRRRKPRAASTSPATATAEFGCKVLQTGPGQLEFNVTTTGGATYSGTVHVTFYDYAGSGDTFPPTAVQGAAPVGSWHRVPAADIGASAEPTGCTASAG